MQLAQEPMAPMKEAEPWSPAMNLDRFRQQGVAVFESLLQPAECQALKGEIDQLLREGRNIATELPAHADLVTHPKLMAITKMVLGGEFAFHHMHTARHDAGI